MEKEGSKHPGSGLPRGTVVAASQPTPYPCGGARGARNRARALQEQPLDQGCCGQLHPPAWLRGPSGRVWGWGTGKEGAARWFWKVLALALVSVLLVTLRAVPGALLVRAPQGRVGTGLGFPGSQVASGAPMSRTSHH